MMDLPSCPTLPYLFMLTLSALALGFALGWLARDLQAIAAQISRRKR